MGSELSQKKLTELENALHGAREMKRMSTTFADRGTEEHDGAKGQLIYDKELKSVFADIARDDDKDPAGKLRFQYAGNYEIVDEKTVIHHIKWATNPKMIGTSMQREFNLGANGELSIIGPSAKYPNAKINIDWLPPKR